MCSAGGPFEVNILDMGEKDYRCKDCGKKFKEASSNPSCPKCKSTNVVTV